MLDFYTMIMSFDLHDRLIDLVELRSCFRFFESHGFLAYIGELTEPLLLFVYVLQELLFLFLFGLCFLIL